MDDARNISQYCQEDVDQEVGIAAALEEDTERWEDDGEDDLADVAVVRAASVMTPIYNSTDLQIKCERNSLRRDAESLLLWRMRELETYLAVNAMTNELRSESVWCLDSKD